MRWTPTRSVCSADWASWGAEGRWGCAGSLSSCAGSLSSCAGGGGVHVGPSSMCVRLCVSARVCETPWLSGAVQARSSSVRKGPAKVKGRAKQDEEGSMDRYRPLKRGVHTHTASGTGLGACPRGRCVCTLCGWMGVWVDGCRARNPFLQARIHVGATFCRPPPWPGQRGSVADRLDGVAEKKGRSTP